MEKFTVDFYSTENGKQPVKDFLMSLNPKMIAKFLKITELLENNGEKVGMPYSRNLEKGIFEIRVISNNNIVRILYFFTKNKIKNVEKIEFSLAVREKESSKKEYKTGMIQTTEKDFQRRDQEVARE